MEGWQVREILAANTRRFRKLLGYTQASLAEEVGISCGYMCDIENSHKWPSSTILTRLASVLKLDPYQLILPTEDSPYFDRYRTLTSFSQQVKSAMSETIDEVYDGLMKPYGPMRSSEKGNN